MIDSITANAHVGNNFTRSDWYLWSGTVVTSLVNINRIGEIKISFIKEAASIERK